MNDSENELLFSAASLCETAIKNSLGRADFRANPRLLRRGLLKHGYGEQQIASEHVVMGIDLPALRNVAV